MTVAHGILNATMSSLTKHKNGGIADKYCREWVAAQHGLFQTAGIFFAAAFLIPHSAKLSIILSRFLLCLGFLMFVLWSGIYVCALDVFAWNFTFIVINFCHAMFFTIKYFPPRLPRRTKELYERVFLPLRMSKQHFNEFTKDITICSLEKGQVYAKESSTPCNQGLAILLKGRLKVTYQGIFLHYIEPNQFLDSPEWEAFNNFSTDENQLFQVTITAEKACVYVSWSRDSLLSTLNARPYLHILLHNLIGKDIAQKLYSLNESHSHVANTVNKPPPSKASHPIFPRSASVDAVHTGATGFMHSLAWKGQHESRRPSLLPDSKGFRLNHLHPNLVAPCPVVHSIPRKSVQFSHIECFQSLEDRSIQARAEAESKM